MLRITVHQDGALCRLELAGRLGGPWVAETENAWRSAPRSGKETVVDIREVTGVDGAGRDLLAAMHHAGVRLVAEGVAMIALIEEIAGAESSNGSSDRKLQRRRKATNPSHSEDSRDQER
jgi:hypothetical protein